jgi:V/A-type H+-transporting ATPase subunit E
MKSMEPLEQGKQKLSEICDLLRKDTLEPAQKEASSIIENAKAESQKLINTAKGKAQAVIEDAHKKNEQERILFNTSLDVAATQTFSKLKEEIETKLFNRQLKHLVQQIVDDPKNVARLVNVMVEAIAKEGLNGNLLLQLGKAINPEKISELLIKEVADQLEKKEIPIETISGGVVICLKDKQMSVDMSDEALRDLLGTYLRPSFREILFKNT